MRTAFLLCLSCFFAANVLGETPEHVGDRINGGTVVSTEQLIHAAGQSVEFGGRPVDLCLSPDQKTIYVKDNRGLVVIDAATMKVGQELAMSGTGGSMHGIVASPDGSHVYLTSAQSLLFEGQIDSDGTAKWSRKIDLPKAKGYSGSQAAGLAITRDGKRLIVCLAMNNSIGVVDLDQGKLIAEIPVGVAPYGITLSPDEKTAYISNWGGRHPKEGDKSAESAGTQVVIDPSGVAASGTVSVVDLHAKQSIAEIEVGLHPAEVRLTRDGRTLYVANANSDTVSVIDTATKKVTETIGTRPDPALPFGSASNALALSADEKTLYVANGGNNAVAVIQLGSPSKLAGFIPAGWYPGAVVDDGKNLFIANIKGAGTRGEKKAGSTGYSVVKYLGMIGKVADPTPADLARYTEQAKADAHVPQSLHAWEKAQSGVKPVPVPAHIGEPSVFEHVVYIVKENRTYDQVLGDMSLGNGDPSLCIFGKKVTPNHHAIADQFALLDNFYCNGVISADGHAWAMEGDASDYFEKSYGGFTRVYFQGDPLTICPTGFIWDNVLLHGLSFRNYGEKVFPDITPKSTWSQVYDDYTQHAGKLKITYPMSVEVLRPYTCPDYAGWNLRMSDQMRVDAFLSEFEKYKKTGDWPSLVIVYLPQDHTSGSNSGFPTPNAMVADNDLAVGRVVDAVSHSQFWAKTCIFAIEDDPQAGFDHVDGHRSLCLVASPYTKRHQTISQFYNQTSVLHTMELMLGLPPMNQMDAMAPVMTDCFTSSPDLKPYEHQANNIPLDEMNRSRAELHGDDLHFAEVSEQQNLEEPDRIDDDAFNRVIWHATRGNSPYPASWAGPHGRGLKALHLRLAGGKVTNSDGDDD